MLLSLDLFEPYWSDVRVDFEEREYILQLIREYIRNTRSLNRPGNVTHDFNLLKMPIEYRLPE